MNFYIDHYTQHIMLVPDKEPFSFGQIPLEQAKATLGSYTPPFDLTQHIKDIVKEALKAENERAFDSELVGELEGDDH